MLPVKASGIETGTNKSSGDDSFVVNADAARYAIIHSLLFIYLYFEKRESKTMLPVNALRIETGTYKSLGIDSFVVLADTAR